ncbi:MAG: glycosyltransferase family 39 protein [Candidimonas sp.]|nr:glycosyltransferase family 39 protein [Candidimonas sp.]
MQHSSEASSIESACIAPLPKPRLATTLTNVLDVQSTWLVAAVSLLWLSATTGLYPLLLPDEGRYVGIAWHMLSTGQYAVPMLDGLPFFHKPPLFYWLTALSLSVFGVNEWAARLVSVGGAVLTITVLFWFLKNYVNTRIALLAALILMSSPLLFGASHYANMDMTVGGLVTATIVALAVAALGYEQHGQYRTALLTAYAVAAAAFLTKGLIGIVIPGGVIFFWLLWRRRYDTMRRLLWLPGIAIFLLLALPWMYAMQQRYGGFFDYFIVNQHLQRFTGNSFNNAQAVWFYAPVLLGLMLPWSLKLWRLADRAYWRNLQHQRIRSLMLIWLLFVLVFFSLPNSKLVGYILPAIAPFAYFVAEAWAPRLAGTSGARSLRMLGSFLAISLSICIAAAMVMVAWPQPGTKALALNLKSYYGPSDKIVMLERYRYDLPFYLGAGKSIFVVSDWDDPELQSTDNWRRELYDAGRFDPVAAANLLINKQGLLRKLCNDRVVDLWLMGQHDSPTRYPYLQGWVPDLQDGKLRVWHVPAGAPLTFCAEMPKDVQE